MRVFSALSPVYKPALVIVGAMAMLVGFVNLMEYSSRAGVTYVDDHGKEFPEKAPNPTEPPGWGFVGPGDRARIAAFTERVWESVVANPTPVVMAIAVFLFTCAYHVVRGRSIREAVEIAITKIEPQRSTASGLPTMGEAYRGTSHANQSGSDASEEVEETPVMARARNRVEWHQLTTDKEDIERRMLRLPDEIATVQRDVSMKEMEYRQVATDHQVKKERLETVVGRLNALLDEKARRNTELAAVDAELERLKPLV